jgi:peptide/nickel transport system substrate-binding protein
MKAPCLIGVFLGFRRQVPMFISRRLWKSGGLLLALLVAAAFACGGEKIVEKTTVVERTVVVVATPTPGGPTGQVTPTVAGPTPAAKVEPAPQPKGAAGTLTIGVIQLGPGTGWPASTVPAYFLRNVGVGEELFTWSKESPETPELATKWNLKPDLSGVTVEVRKGVKFHNVDKDWGELTAHDLAWSYNQVNTGTNPTSIAASAANFESLFGKNPVVATDDYTLEFKFANFDVRWANYLMNGAGLVGHQSTPKKAADEKGEAWMREHIVSTGPYKVNRWVENDRAEFEATGNHWRKNGQFKTVFIRQIPEEAARVAAMKTGELDAADLALKSTQNMLAGGFKTQGAGRSSQIGIFFSGNVWETVHAGTGQPLPETGNCTRNLPWIGCPKIQGDMDQASKVRRALAVAYDRDLINETVLSGLGYENHVSHWDTKNPNWQSKWEYPYSAEEAKKLLDDAGFKPGANGVRFEFPIFVGPELGGGKGTNGEIGDALAGFWEDIGIETEVLKYAYAVFRPGIVARTNNVPFITTCDDGNSAIPWDFPKGLVQSSLTRGGFSCGFEAPEIAQGYLKMAKEPDIQKRNAISGEILDFVYKWSLQPGVVVVPEFITYNPNSIKSWEMKPTLTGAWTSLENAVPAR